MPRRWSPDIKTKSGIMTATTRKSVGLGCDINWRTSNRIITSGPTTGWVEMHCIVADASTVQKWHASDDTCTEKIEALLRVNISTMIEINE